MFYNNVDFKSVKKQNLGFVLKPKIERWLIASVLLLITYCYISINKITVPFDLKNVTFQITCAITVILYFYWEYWDITTKWYILNHRSYYIFCDKERCSKTVFKRILQEAITDIEHSKMLLNIYITLSPISLIGIALTSYCEYINGNVPAFVFVIVLVGVAYIFHMIYRTSNVLKRLRVKKDVTCEIIDEINQRSMIKPA